MLLTLHTLPQLAVSAKLLCLLMVVICGAVPSMVRSVRLYNVCSHSNVRVDFRGHVLAGSDYDDDGPLQNLTIRSQGFGGKVSIQAVASSLFICFNKHGKVVGAKKFRGSMCQFIETMLPGGVLQYQSVNNSEHYMGFNARGRPFKRPMVTDPRQLECFNFIIFNNFSISQHNKKMTDDNLPHRPPPSRHGDIDHRPDGLRPFHERDKKVPGKKESPGKIRHNHSSRKNKSRKSS